MEQQTSTPGLHKLGDTDLELEDEAQDIRGYRVVDSEGEEIGEVDDLLIDDQESKVRFLEVASGGFLGLGETRFMLPIDVITRIDSETVHVGPTRQHLAGSPSYDPELVNKWYMTELYGYYDVPPFWGPGYVYPRYPD